MDGVLVGGVQPIVVGRLDPSPALDSRERIYLAYRGKVN